MKAVHILKYKHGVHVHVDTWCVGRAGGGAVDEAGLTAEAAEAEETALEATEEEVRAAEVRAAEVTEAEAMEEVVTRRRRG